jgi:hypothetical protein
MSAGYPNAHLSQKKAEMALTMLLFGCTAERLAGFTAASLAGSYRVALPKIEQLLADAKERRGI